jgi:CRP/FNR family transcriptional regulator
MINHSLSSKKFPEMEGFSNKTDCNECKYASTCFVRKLVHKEDFSNQNKFHVNYKKGETIIKEGSHISRILYVIDGLVKVYIEGPDKNIIIRLLKSDDFIELTSLFSDDTYYFSATALKDTLVCSIEHKDLKELTNNCFNFSHELSKWYCANYNTMLTKCLNLGLRQLNGKLANVLLYLNRDEFKEIDIFSYISRKDLAELSGMSQESVARILTEFSKEKIIKIKGKKIEIINMELIQMINQKG